jgi:hypothetical protein
MPQIVLLILIRCRVAFATLALPSVVIATEETPSLLAKFMADSMQPAAGVGVAVGVRVALSVGVAVRVGVAESVGVGVAVAGVV